MFLALLWSFCQIRTPSPWGFNVTVSDYDKKYGQRVEFRVLPDQDNVRQEFFENIEKLHTDRCYVLTMLMKAWNLGVAGLPDPDAQVVLKLPRQNIQLNIGCNFHYHTKKARRTLPTQAIPEMETRKNVFFPLLLEEWPTLNEQQKAYWTEQLRAAGIIPPDTHPPASPGNQENRINFLDRFRGIVRQLSGRVRRWFRRGTQ